MSHDVPDITVCNLLEFGVGLKKLEICWKFVENLTKSQIGHRVPGVI